MDDLKEQLHQALCSEFYSFSDRNDKDITLPLSSQFDAGISWHDDQGETWTTHRLNLVAQS